MFADASCSVQPVTCCPPDRIGFCPACACQLTVWPLVPESAAPRVSGADSRYVPPARATTISPLMFESIASTDDLACVREHGVAELQALPLPVGETNRVLMVAASAVAGAVTAAVRARPRAAATVALDGRRRR